MRALLLASLLLADTLRPSARPAASSQYDANCSLPSALIANTAACQTTVSFASTLSAGTTITPFATGVGVGSLTVKLCSDLTTCAAGNLYATCSVTCLLPAGGVTACTLNKTAVPAATVLTWSISTACLVTNPAVNLTAHLTTP